MPAFSCFVPTNNFDTLPRRGAKPPVLARTSSPAPTTNLLRKPSGYDGRRRSSAPPATQPVLQRKRLVSKDSISNPSDFVHVGHNDARKHTSTPPEALSPVQEGIRSPRPTSYQQIRSNLPLESKSAPNLARLSSPTATPVISTRLGEGVAPVQQKRKPPPPVTQSIIRQAGSFAVINSASHSTPFSLPPPVPHSTLKLSKLFLPPDDPSSTSTTTLDTKQSENKTPALQGMMERGTMAGEVQGELQKPNPPFARVPPATNSTQLRWDSALLDIENALR